MSDMAVTATSKGLSPRVRGHLLAPLGMGLDSGSIPACAGAPIAMAQTVRRPKVYPRVCGGTHKGTPVEATRKGLSPRVRGHRSGSPQSVPRSRSIPACAGAPQLVTLVSKRVQVYPRVCGGTSIQTVTRIVRRGLSPRVRGHRTDADGHTTRRGSIPACAGAPLFHYVSTTGKSQQPTP